jgi:hypothetical protein
VFIYCPLNAQYQAPQSVNARGGVGSSLTLDPTYVLCCYPSLPIATAVSAMRLEKPHSLSYQASTRTRRPSTICV